MKTLEKQHVKIIERACRIATLLGVDVIILDQACIRGDNREEAIIFLQHFEPGEYSYPSIAIPRVTALTARMRMFDNEMQIDVDTKIKDNSEEFVTRMKLSQKKTNIEFKCADPATFRIPKRINQPDCYKFFLNKDSYLMLSKSKSAMDSNILTFTTVDGSTLVVKVMDKDNDVFEHTIDDPIVQLPDAEIPTFSKKFKYNTIMKIFKEALDTSNGQKVEVFLTNKGTLRLKIYDISIYILPEV